MPLWDAFEDAPELYHRVRPGYPDELFDASRASPVCARAHAF
jgi:hypothetical protein